MVRQVLMKDVAFFYGNGEIRWILHGQDFLEELAAAPDTDVTAVVTRDGPLGEVAFGGEFYWWLPSSFGMADNFKEIPDGAVVKRGGMLSEEAYKAILCRAFEEAKWRPV